MLALKTPTDLAWVEAVKADFDAFLVDHAACERKASATGMSFVVRYPDRPKLIGPMVAFAREELEHFEQVWAIMKARGLRLAADTRDPYLDGLMPWVRRGRDERLLDRLVLGSVVEARGCERFGILGEQLDDPEMRSFYADLQRSEARHAGLFLRLARYYFEAETIDARVEDLLSHEAEVIAGLKLRPALH